MLIDAICQITGTTEKYSSPIPEPFTFIPEDQRSIELADGSISSSFLETVRPSVARHRPGIGAEQPSHGRPATAPAEFEPHPAQDRAEPEAARAAASEAQAARDRRRALPDDSLALSDRRGVEDRSTTTPSPARQGRRPDDGPGLGVDQQRGVSVSALMSSDEDDAVNHERSCARRCMPNSTTRRRCERDCSRGARRCAAAWRARPGCCWPSGLALPAWPQTPAGQAAKAKSVIQIWMWGGPSHLDTFDPKPEAGNDYCGPLNKPIATNVDGIVIGELLPLLAKQADKYSIIRSMTHGINAHETAAYMVQTGRKPGEPDWSIPSVGAVVSLFKGYDAGYRGLIPPYIVLTAAAGAILRGRIPGRRATNRSPPAAIRPRAAFAVEGVVAQGITDEQQRDRRELLHKLNTLRACHARTIRARRRSAESEKQAYDLILGDAGKLFDLSQEKDELRDRYGRNTFGQSCLMARRLVERGVPYVTINYKGWDTHKQHFQTMRRKLPEMDKGMATLLAGSVRPRPAGQHDRLVERRVRPHAEGPVGSALERRTRPLRQGLLGRGRRRRIQGRPRRRRVRRQGRSRSRTGPSIPCDLIGSMYELLGIDPDAKLPHPQGLPVRVMPTADDGVKMGGRLKEIM